MSRYDDYDKVYDIDESNIDDIDTRKLLIAALKLGGFQVGHKWYQSRTYLVAPNGAGVLLKGEEE